MTFKPITVVVSLLFVVTYAISKTDQDLGEVTNLFTANMYKESIKKGHNNLFISPFSVEIALALAQSGGKDDTAKEIRAALHFSNVEEKIQKTFKDYLTFLKGDDQYFIQIANKVYVQEKFTIKNDFKTVATDTYYSDIENIDFSQSDKASESINQWIEEQTEHKIKNLVIPSNFSGGTLAVIVNALYFKAPWINQDFHKNPIVNESFFKSFNEEIKANFMINQGARYRLHEDSTLAATFLEVPFTGDDAQMVFVLPKRKNGLVNIEKQPDLVFKRRQFEITTVDVKLPLFNIESTFDFKEVLQNLGIIKGFTSGKADFSGIAGDKGDLFLGGVIQKNYINVNQDGVEATAATFLRFVSSDNPKSEKTFNANHPFIFYIKIKDVILFAGRVIDPTL